MKARIKYIFSGITVSFFLIHCANTDNFSIPPLDCVPSQEAANKSIEDIQQFANQYIKLYPAKDIISGVVISSDEGGNFYNKLYIIDEHTEQLAILSIEMGASFVQFPPGTQVNLNLEGLYIQKNYDKLTLGGGIYTSGKGNQSVDAIAKNAVKHYLSKYCEPVENFEQYNHAITLEDLTNGEDFIGKLVTINHVQFERSIVGKTLYDPQEVDQQKQTLRKVVDEKGNTIFIRTSRFSNDFVDYSIPENSGSITGIADKFQNQIQFYPRSLADIQLNQDAFIVDTIDPTDPGASNEIAVEPGKYLAFPGADFEDWEAFNGVLTSSGIKLGTSVDGGGWRNSTGLQFVGEPEKTENAFVVTGVKVPKQATELSFLMKGTAFDKSWSINLYQQDGTYVAYNLKHVSTSKHVKPTKTNKEQKNINIYKGTIDTKGNWIKIILDIDGFAYNTSGVGPLIAFKYGGQTNGSQNKYNVVIDEIRFEDGQLAEEVEEQEEDTQ
ncbi:DUF5689 domain-containing protein [Myroides sp. DW712]|uniref:DUF5689 domain-containing protein n=1 Tax=Myroides sp. DW712 TaxID=3389800 RepID=UPI00397CF3F9